MFMCLNVHLQHISNYVYTSVISQCLREGHNNLNVSYL